MKRAIKRATERLERNRDNRRTASAEALAHAELHKLLQRIEQEDAPYRITHWIKAERRADIEELPSATDTLAFIRNLDGDEDGKNYFVRKYVSEGLTEAIDETRARQGAIMRIENLIARTAFETSYAVKLYFDTGGRDDREENYSDLLADLSLLDAKTPEETARRYSYAEEAFLVYLSARQSTDYRAKPLGGELSEHLEEAYGLNYIEHDCLKLIDHYCEQLEAGYEELEDALRYCDTYAIARDALKGNSPPETPEEIRTYLDSNKLAEYYWIYGFTFNGEHYLEQGY